MVASDRKKLEAAQQALNLARQSSAELCKAEDPIWAKHAYDLLEPQVNMEQKLEQLLPVSK